MRLTLVFAAGMALAIQIGCNARPVPPVITPQSAEVVSVTPAGLGMRVRLSAHNPNSYDVMVRTVDAHVTVAGRDLGTSQSLTPFTLASQRDVPITATLTIPWNDLSGLVAATLATPVIAYHLDGTVAVGVRDVSLNVPFQMDGTMPREQLVSAAMNSFLPNGVIPSLPMLQGLPNIPGLTITPMPQPPPR